MLASIGLGHAEESAYRTLVSLGAAELDDLALRLGIDAVGAERLMLTLEREGLVSRAASRSGRCWVAAPPAVALRALLTQKRHELEKAELAAAQLAETFRSEATHSDVHDLVEVVVGAEAVAHRFRQLQRGASKELLALVSGKPVAVSASANDAEEQAVARGVAYRVVLERAALDEADALRELTAALRREEETRLVDRVPTKLMIADRAAALVPLSADDSRPAALVVQASGTVAALCALFESVWERAWPLSLAGTGKDQTVVATQPAPEPLDQLILELMIAGHTDHSIAKHLEISLRTLQRRIRGLFNLTGVTSRMQLGWEAHARGWVTRTPR
ncbi:helix-turn-helix domain-containing protein [Mumia sp. ZJ430]|uniref:helix-turn-helix domain-containing protein n=1 Tax=Mumia sp. ZJ430 TaxID=2708083 RepID=UPI001421E71B|nr:helix-turn-helix domain-containing protein [Mumia sp. ZJ430]